MHEYEKPVLESNEKFFVLDAHICFLENCCLKMKRDIKTIGNRQYTNFHRDALHNEKDIQSPIKQNKISIFQFHTRMKKSPTAKKKMRD